jgi:hypothetical protein
LFLAALILLLLFLGALAPKDHQPLLDDEKDKPMVEKAETIQITVSEWREEVPAAAPKPAPQPPKTVSPPPQPPVTAPLPLAATPASTASTKETAGFTLPISANYRRTLGFRKYAESMLALGGTFLIFDGDKIRATVDVLNPGISTVELNQLAGMSPRSREITDVALASCLEEARLRLGAGYYSVILLLPIQKDAEIQQAALRMLDASGAKASDVIRIEAEYRKDGNRLELVFTEVLLRDQPPKTVNFAITL